jgi:hypothetical protein
MPASAPLTPDELLSLTEIGGGMIFGLKPLPAEHLARLLRLGFIKSRGGRYEATPSGLFQIAHGT